MLADGHGHQLYDAAAQRVCQARYSGRVGTLYIHPPFEAVIYLTVAWLPLERAYFLWSALNLAFLAIALRHLTKQSLVPWDWGLLLAASITFVPVLLCFAQGQDSLLLLLLIVLAFTSLRGGRIYAAGCWLGLGLFKFQIVLPMVTVLLLTQKGSAKMQLAKGFGLVALALAGLSAFLSGWSVFLTYPKFLLHLQGQAFAGVAPLAMANFRGLTYFMFRSDSSPGPAVVIVILCVAALLNTIRHWNSARQETHSGNVSATEFDLAVSNTILFALLVSYHLNPHDLSLLLLPTFLLLHGMLAFKPLVLRRASWMTAALLGILFLPPLHIWTLRFGLYALVSVPLLVLFLIVPSSARQDTAGRR